MESMGRYKPGDKVEVVVKRDGKEVKLQVTLGSRPGSASHCWRVGRPPHEALPCRASRPCRTRLPSHDRHHSMRPPRSWC